MFLDSLKRSTNYTTTENGAISYKSTLNNILDLFAFGGSYRNRRDEDCIILFKKALQENEELAMKCLFYLRDVRQGQGERRFFRVCFRWLAINHTEIAKRNLEYIAEYGRWDDLIYSTINTPLEKIMAKLVKEQIMKDCAGDGLSLCAKWLPSCNTSSKETRAVARKLVNLLNTTEREYRKTLSKLRKKIKIVERFMSENKWEDIDFSKLPSKAGLKYRITFLNKEQIAEKYKEFINSKETKVNAKVLYPYDIAHLAFNDYTPYESTERKTIQKYWEALPDYYKGKEENAICICDVSGSMSGRPLEAAVALSAYIAERTKGEFANHFITFSHRPELVEFEGVDIVDKINRARRADWGFDTNLEAVFDLLLDTIMKNSIPAAEIPERLYIFTDMEFNAALRVDDTKPLLDAIERKWNLYGYKIPNIVFWNLDAKHNLIPSLNERFSYVSGLSPVMIEAIFSGKTSWDLCIEKLVNSGRYKNIK